MTQDPNLPGGGSAANRGDDGERLLDAAIAASRRGPSAATTATAREAVRTRLFGAVDGDAESPCTVLRPDIAALLAGTLPDDRAALVDDHCRECVPCRKHLVALRDGVASPAAGPARAAATTSPRRRWLGPLVGLAAAAAFAGFFGFMLTRDGAPEVARVAELRGTLLLADTGAALEAGAAIPEGRAVRTTRGSRALVTLPDGSRIELNERAQVSFETEGEALTVDLDRGDVIFEAAKRKARNLFVHAGDCTVAVKGTVFTVRHGLKGSRVGVLEGSVHVDRSGHLSVLGPGDQVATDPTLEPQSLGEQVAWSLEADRWTDLLGEIEAAADAVEKEGPRGAPRHESAILGAMPDTTVLFAAVPNDGELSRLAEEISERIAGNPRLAGWWKAQLDPSADKANFAVMLDTLRRLSDSLGEEVVFALIDSTNVDVPPTPVLAAPLRDEAGLRRLVADLAPDGREPRFLTSDELKSLEGGDSHQPLLVIHAGHVLAGASAEALREVVSGLDQGQPHETSFLASLEGQYDRGAEFLVAADLARTVGRRAERVAARAAAEGDLLPSTFVQALGVPNVDQFVLTAGTHDPGTAVLSFRENRSGVAAWLAEPGPMGSLQFVTPEATFAAAALFQDPSRMLADLESYVPDGKLEQFLSSFTSETGLDLREDLIRALGGEMALALDGPALPEPSWKLILEVDDAARLESALSRLAERAAEAAREQGLVVEEPLVRDVKTSEGVTRALRLGPVEVHYAIRDGYFVATPNGILLESALQASSRGASLATHPALVQQLPGGERDAVSLLAWQDASRLLGQLSASGALGMLPAGARPFVDAASTPALGWARASDRTIAFGVAGPEAGLGGGLARLVRRGVVEALARQALTGSETPGEDALAPVATP